MATPSPSQSPSANSTTSAVSPASASSPPPTSVSDSSPSSLSSPPPPTSIKSPPSHTNATSPSTPSPSTNSSPPPAISAAPPPSTSSSSPPPQTSPETSPLPPSPSSPAVPPSPSNPPPPPPPSQSSPPTVSSPPPSTPPPTSPPPTSSPTPSSTPPPRSSPVPPASTPSLNNSPPPSQSSPSPASAANPPTTSTPSPASAPPPKMSPPPPAAIPPETSPSPTPSEVPSPGNAPLAPKLTPPASQPSPSPTPSTVPSPGNAPSPPMLTPSASQPSPPPSSNHTSAASPSPPPTVIRLSPVSPSHNPPSNSPPSRNTTTPASSSSTGSGGIGTGGVVAIGVAAGILMLSLIGLIAWCLRKKKRDASGLNGGYVMPSCSGSPLPSDSASSKMQSRPPLIGSGPSSYSSGTPRPPNDLGGLGNSTSWFTHKELVDATNGFSSENLLGEGGFGSVYKGSLPDGRVVAVKQLKIGGGQGEREFKAEVEIISRIHHRHLVSLVGYCIHESNRLLVYEYVPNNTLHSHLHGEGRPVLDWVTRVKIAAGAARGIAYLHEDCHPRIIHRDIKSSNILLDNNYETKVSDFGLAKLALDANTHVTTRVMGTFGYVAPEYASSGKLTEKSDVFSYGVVLLELITGRKPVDTSQPLGYESLVEWARPLLSYALDNEEFDGLVDPRLQKNYVESEMFRMIEAAAACVRHSAAKRPRMGQIVRAFDSLATADLTNGMRVGESEVFHSAQQSAEVRLFRRMAFGSQNYSTDFFSQGSLGTNEHTANTSREQYHSSISGTVRQIEMEP